MKKMLFVILFVVMIFILCSCKCEHVWTEASCLEPKTCSLCDETEGNALGHNWKEATCNAPETCSRCLETRGVSLDHAWEEATCFAPKTCSVCESTEGEPAHQEGNWKTYSADMVGATVTSKKHCILCDIELDEQTVPLKQLHDTEKFLCSPNEFVIRLDNMFDIIPNCTLSAQSGSAKDEFVCGIFNGDESVGILMFAGKNGPITTDQKNKPCFSSILGSVDTQNMDNAAHTTIALALAADPSFEFEDATNLGIDLSKKGDCEKNQLIYSVLFTGDSMIQSLSIKE